MKPKPPHLASAAVLAALLAAAVVAVPVPAAGEACTVDAGPAATLLLPYFEVDWQDPDGVTTLFSINNASSEPVLAHVTLWTDESVPTLDFDVYLTGYDVQTINLRDVFHAILPATADAARDPADLVSPQGALSGDATFPGCQNFPYVNPAVSASLLAHLRSSHTGGFSSVYGGCLGLDYGDGIARGYVTVDSSSQCNLEFPNSAGYFVAGGGGLANDANVLWGDYFYVVPEGNLAQGETLVHVEAFPGRFGAGDYTFYGRYVAASGADDREPLATTFAARYILAGLFDGGTDLIVWRDSKTDTASAHACGSAFPWFPLNQTDVVAFDERETAVDLCFRGDNVSPPTGGADTCFPAETQRVNLAGTAVPGGVTPDPPFEYGWMYLNLNTDTSGAGGEAAFGATAQAWVTVVSTALDRCSVGYDAIQLDNACYTTPTAGVTLLAGGGAPPPPPPPPGP